VPAKITHQNRANERPAVAAAAVSLLPIHRAFVHHFSVHSLNLHVVRLHSSCVDEMRGLSSRG
jgi:hypothetical protein